MMKIDNFTNRKLLIATKHGKEQVIGPTLRQKLQVDCWTPSDYDTDLLGTFTGEKERLSDPVTAAKQKCLMALDKYNCDLAIASEGSFGPHPECPFLTINEEIIFLVDQKFNFEMFIRECFMDTNFSGSDIHNEKELVAFAASALFPQHGLIMKDVQDNFTEVRKGMVDWNDVVSAYQYFMLTYGKVYVETDMRAHVNPTRMQNIHNATLTFVNAVFSKCPDCQYPGFIVSKTKKGLPCQLCRNPTNSTLSHISICRNCGYTEEKMYPHNKKYENPGFCNDCNP